MKRSLVCLLFLSSVTCADVNQEFKKLAADGAESFAKTFGSELAKTAIGAISKACSKESTLKEALANITLKKEKEKLKLVKTLGELDKKDLESGLNEKEIAQRDNIKLCIAALMQKQGN